MNQGSMTALVSAYARWYHAAHNEVKAFDDTVAGALLTEAEKQNIKGSMAGGIAFFCPGFEGTQAEALRWIVDHQLSPSPLGRAAFCEEHLEKAVQAGARQYLVLAAGYDTFAYRRPDWARALTVVEVDRPAMAGDKQARLAAAGIAIPENTHYAQADFADAGWMEALRAAPAFDEGSITFCSLLGLSYYLAHEDFACLLGCLVEALPNGSAFAFDYPDQDSGTEKAGGRAHRQTMMAGAAGEAMRAGYAYEEMEALLTKYGLAAQAHLRPEAITARYFAAYNAANPAHPITALDHVHYCLASKVSPIGRVR